MIGKRNQSEPENSKISGENIMSHAKLAIVVAILTLAALPGRSYAVTNAVVGKCKAETQFTTIQAAVNAATMGSTVQVCGGLYPE